MPIKVDKIDGGLPVSVIVPLSEKRRTFFNNFVLPLIEANEVNEIIVNDNVGSAPKKRNDGFKRATQPYIFFCDDDILLPSNHIESLLNALKTNPEKGYAYTGYHGIVLDPSTHPMRGNFGIKSIYFNGDLLRQQNFISTMTLVKKDIFPMFDENLKRLQDWDVWLTLLERGYEGIAVNTQGFFAFYLDEGITSNTNNEMDAINAIKRKHSLFSNRSDIGNI